MRIRRGGHGAPAETERRLEQAERQAWEHKARRADVTAKLAELNSSVKTLAQPQTSTTTMMLMMAMLARR